MKLINHIITIGLLTGSMLTASLPSGAAPASIFPEKSVLAEGKWIKLHIDKTGIYELTFDELKAMGFSNPDEVGLYGRGGALQPTQFVNPGGESYMSDLQPVSMLVKNGKIYFFAQANPKVRYCYENDSRASAMRFDQDSNQVFSNDIVYFITDTPESRKLIEQAEGTANAYMPTLKAAWAYSYHEVDKFTPKESGRDFFGESFLNENARTQTFDYDIPGAVVDSQACITAVFAAAASTPSSLEYGFKDGTTGTSNISSLGDDDNYKYNARTHMTLPIPASKGEVIFKFTPGEDLTFAGLDYFVVGAKREMKFHEGESQFMVFPYEFTDRKYNSLEMPEAKESYGAWQVTDSGNVKELKYQINKTGNKSNLLYLENNHIGPVVFIDYAQEQYKISGYEPVANQNLHALGIDKMPSMLIITLPELKPAADRLAQIHKDYEGIDVAVVLHKDVVNEFSAGVDDPMAYRALAKMLYDRDNPDNRVFKNILLLGPNVRDHRNILGLCPEIGTLISNQTYSSSLYDFTYCLNDWYGMMDDRTEYEQSSAFNFFSVPMQIGVGMIPVNDLTAANAAVNKIARFYADDSYAYWLGNYNYAADGGDNNEHQNWEDVLWTAMDDYTLNGGLGTKIYNNLCKKGSSGELFRSKVNEGAMLSFYTGHASSQAMSSDFFDMGDERKFTNSRYGMALLGACMLSPFDSNKVGIGAKVFNLPETGFLAVVASSRDAYSRHNFNLLNHLQYFLMNDSLESDKRLSKPRTIGEAYAMAKSALDNHPNKFSFHLFGDPAIVLPMPTAEINVNLAGTSEVYPGAEFSFKGEVTDRDGAKLTNFNGTVVVKLCAPAVERTTSSFQNSPSVKVNVDQSVLLTSAFDVTDGTFSGSMLVPADAPSSATVPATLRLTAYDTNTRTAAIGGLKMQMNEYDINKAVKDDNAPVIESLYANDPSVREDAALPSNFVLHADVTDDYGVMAFETNGIPGMYITIDNRVNCFDTNGYVTLSKGGKKAHLAYPVNGLAPGTHIITLVASDANGQKDSRNIAVRIGSVFDASCFELETEGPVRSQVTLQVKGNDASRTDRVRILDSRGNIVLEQPVTNGQFVWNLQDNSGNRVREGVYYAVNIQTSDEFGTAVSEPCEIIVFK